MESGHSLNKPVAGIFSKMQPLEYYQWGDGCDGWTLVKDDQLSVKLERMPAGTFEARHYHQFSQQFFYILKGLAYFEIEETGYEVKAGEGIHIKPGIKHRIYNHTNEDLEFLLCSQPSTGKDRINC